MRHLEETTVVACVTASDPIPIEDKTVSPSLGLYASIHAVAAT